MSVQKQNILLFIPKFLNYDKQIADKLQGKGNKVFSVYENIDSFDLVYKVLIHLFPKIKYKLASKIYDKKLKKNLNNVNYVIVIRGSLISKKYIEILKKRYMSAQFIMYQWDSVLYNKNAIDIAAYFDRVLTFDMVDAQKYEWIYRPLFYDKDHINHNSKKMFDIAYICSIHSNRILIYKKLKQICLEKNIKYYSYLYSSKRSYISHKYFLNDKLLKSVSKEIYTDILSPEELNQIYDASKIIIDYTYPKQNGLTMRTIESIGHHCKLITNNKNVLQSNFYNEDNVYIYNDENLEIPKDFLLQEYKLLNSTIYEYYSLDRWIDDIFGILS